MTSELHVSFTIPAEYARGAKQDMVLDMPISYAQGLAKVIGDGCQHALIETVLHDCPELRDISPYVLLRDVAKGG